MPTGDNKWIEKNQCKNKGQAMSDLSLEDDTTPVCLAFKGYAKELDAKHDRYERIVKLGRDITIESKRIIFLLHNIDPSKNNYEKIISEAKDRFNTLINVNFLAIAKQLEGVEVYQFLRAYSPGVNEFIEAYSYFEYLTNVPLSSCTELNQLMTYKKDEAVTEDSTKSQKYINCFVDPTEHILGLADLTGELMRKCINALGSGDINNCFVLCRSLQEFYTCYIGLMVNNRELYRKIQTLRQSLLKTENVCYNIKVRGEEAAKRGISMGDVKGNSTGEADEGFFTK